MKYLLIAFSLMSSMTMAKDQAKDQPEVTYGGLGHYYCSGTSAQCAIINQNNKLLDEREVERREWRDEKMDRYERETREINDGRR